MKVLTFEELSSLYTGEEKSDSDYSFIVSIEGRKKHDVQHVGTGFIVGEYLITAGHVVEDQGYDYFYRFKKKDYLLNKLLYWKYHHIEKSFDEEQDLAIFKIDNLGSPYRLNSSGLIYGERIYRCCGYAPGFSDDKGEFVNENRIDIVVPHKPNILNGRFPCIEVGRSGGPVIKDNIVYGMLVRDYHTTSQYEGFQTFISGSYIGKVLKSI